MPCGTETVDCQGCGKHDLKSMYRCKLCQYWFCSECVFQALPTNVCVSCLMKAVDSYALSSA